jgi:hypothetical protein
MRAMETTMMTVSKIDHPSAGPSQRKEIYAK